MKLVRLLGIFFAASSIILGGCAAPVKKTPWLDPDGALISTVLVEEPTNLTGVASASTTMMKIMPDELDELGYRVLVSGPEAGRFVEVGYCWTVIGTKSAIPDARLTSTISMWGKGRLELPTIQLRYKLVLPSGKVVWEGGGELEKLGRGGAGYASPLQGLFGSFLGPPPGESKESLSAYEGLATNLIEYNLFYGKRPMPEGPFYGR